MSKDSFAPIFFAVVLTVVSPVREIGSIVTR